MQKKQLNGIMLTGIILVSVFLYAVEIQPTLTQAEDQFTFSYELKQFSTYKELSDFLRNNSQWRHARYYVEDGMVTPNIAIRMTTSKANGNTATPVDYSTTNIQVEGVDEPDIVKTDGQYLYVVAEQVVYIIKAWPAADASILASIDLNQSISNLFINGDRLIVFGTSREYHTCRENTVRCPWFQSSNTYINVYDISTKTNPELTKEVEVAGYFFDARMIGDYVYAITTQPSYYLYDMLENNETIVPFVRVNQQLKPIPPSDIIGIDSPSYGYALTNVVSIDVNDESDNVSQKIFLQSSSHTLYVSQNNIYLTYQTGDETQIHKIAINQGSITYITNGTIPGSILNQFSMDEHNGFLRVATTVGHVWDRDRKSSNNIYILNQNLSIASKIEEIAPGERIYSARFMGDRAYLVTFKKVDPLFTLDLSDPYNPQILGKLKIPGYSDYLHPYDEHHIIGIGKDTVEAQLEKKERRGLDFAWYQGIKIALFDISDFENPKVCAKVIIGDRGTSSPALYDHKAFLFDRSKNLLVIPVSLYEISDEIKEQHNNYTGSMRGDFTFQGAYVYHLSPEKGFELQGRITHQTEEEQLKAGYYYGSGSAIRRSIYIEDMLYTVSNNMIKIHDLQNLSHIKTIEFE